MIEMNEKLLDGRMAEQQVQGYESPKVSVEKGYAASHGYNGFGDETNW